MKKIISCFMAMLLWCSPVFAADGVGNTATDYMRRVLNFIQTHTGGGAGGSSSSGACTGSNCFSPVNYPGWHGNGHEVLDASWSGTSVTFPNNDGNLTAAMNGWDCWGMPQSMQAGPVSPGVLTVTGAQSATCTQTIGTASSNGDFNWGQNDDAAWNAAINALYTQPKCGSIVIPTARSLILHGLSYTGTIAADCAIFVQGAGYSSNLVMEPGFNFSASNNVGCTALGCFFNTTASTVYLYFNMNGSFQSLSGISTAPASALFTIGAGSYSIGVNGFNWATAASNTPKALNINGTGPFTLGVAITNWGDGNYWCSGNYCITQNAGSNSATLKTQGNSLEYDYSGTFGGSYTTGSGAETHLIGTATQANNGGFGSASCDHNGGELVYMQDAKIGGIGSVGASGIGFQFNALGSGANCVVHAIRSKFVGGASGAAINVPSGVTADFYDDGGNSNTYSSPFLTNAGTFRYHHRETGVCTFAAATTCVVTFNFTFGNSTQATVLIPPNIPATATTLTISAISNTGFTMTASALNSSSVSWEAVLQ